YSPHTPLPLQDQHSFPTRRSSDLESLEQRVLEHTYPNGLKLLILERHFSPTVSIRMMFRTGSVDEVSGKTGLAHMFEHMMFKGRSEEHTSELQSRFDLVCRLLLEK